MAAQDAGAAHVHPPRLAVKPQALQQGEQGVVGAAQPGSRAQGDEQEVDGRRHGARLDCPSMACPVVSVVVPTRERADYLEVTLGSLGRQDLSDPYEVVVVSDGSRDATPDVARRAGVRLVAHPEPRGPNAARNTGVEACHADLVAFVDDDVDAPPGWLRALVAGAARHPRAEAFGGPISARLEGPAPRGCGRELPPITTLDLGPHDTEALLVWSANMLVRRSAFDRVGPFDADLPTGGDEEEWLRRLVAAGGRVIYLAAAGLDHRREGEDVRLGALMRSAYGRGRNLRAHDSRRGAAPTLAREARVLVGCGWHLVRRRCPQGLVMGAHSAGRTVEALLEP
jgi:GT2 family glycosyltransferase